MIYLHFKTKELVCRCGCGKALMNPEFMEKVEMLRVEYGRPLIVSSAYRCPNYNRIVSNSYNGPHTQGKAIDFKVYGEHAHDLLSKSIKIGFKGIGINQSGNIENRFIHLDDAETLPRPWVWSY